MAATIVITCPQCKKQMKAPAELEGKKVRCKDCGTAFPAKGSAPAAPSKAPAAEASKPAQQQAGQAAKPAHKAAVEVPQATGESAHYGLVIDDAPYVPPPPDKTAEEAKAKEKANQPAYGVTDDTLAVRCPNCAKVMEKEDAIICLHCGYNTRTRQAAVMRRVEDITPADRFQWRLPGLACIGGIIFITAFDLFFCFGMNKTWKYLDTEVVSTFSAGARTWVVVPSLWVMWKMAKFAYNRLVLNPNPPEVEIKK